MTGRNDHALRDHALSVLKAAADGGRSRQARGELAERLAFDLWSLAELRVTPTDARHNRMLARLLDDPRGQALTSALTDRLLRSQDPARAAEQTASLIERFGAPSFMTHAERLALRGAKLAHGAAPSLVTSAVARQVRKRARHVLLPSDPSWLAAHVARRRAEGARVNVNQLGEALLGEVEAEARSARYAALAKGGVADALSVKVSSIGSQLNLLAFEHTTAVLAGRLARIYRASLEGPADRRPLVMLDMEAYRDAELTLAVLDRALEEPGLACTRAGVVLQAYLPDSHALLDEVRRIAQRHLERGGRALRVRIVKGANLASEGVDAERSGWRPPTFATKLEADAHYKHLLERLLEPEATRLLAVGAASHNVFDLAYALVLAEERGLGPQLEIELLEGMAEPLRKALCEIGARLLVYAPICADDELNSGIAYLVRRLDENTASDNFLRHSFGMRAGDAAFERQRQVFRRSLAQVEALDLSPRRRGQSSHDRGRADKACALERFANEPDTDFAQEPNRAWVRAALTRELAAAGRERQVGSVVAGEPCRGHLLDGFDPSRPGQVPYRLACAEPATVERALACAQADAGSWSQRSLEARAHLLSAVAQGLRERRAELIAAMVMDAGKRVEECDTEISEAVDFAEYYRHSYGDLLREGPLEATPRGVVVVTPPWNFPLAIPMGGVLAALMAGNRVILKPALETAYVGALVADLAWRAGVPKEALQLVICEDEVGGLLIRDPRTDAVILTGATDTARLFQRLRPGRLLLGETGGKNAFIVSALADRELAIRDVVRSAFGHAGQKCSAASLLILEAEVYDDPAFLETLKDAATSLPVGSAYAPESFVTPLIHPPRGALARALEALEPGETWLVEPEQRADNPRLVTPGIKLGVRAGSFTHRTELFGPLLGVMRADDLEHAFSLANATGYGLTAGLASLDEREQARFIACVRAGNLYINRTITGAIVRRQPFGGLGRSGCGKGAKAGGPNYVAQLAHLRAASDRTRCRSGDDLAPSATLRAELARWSAVLGPADARELYERARSYDSARVHTFARLHDPNGLHAQQNVLRYLPCRGLVVRAATDAAPLDLASSALAATLAAARIEISVAPGLAHLADAERLGHPVRVEGAQSLADRLRDCPRIRVLGGLEPALLTLPARLGTHLETDPVCRCGRVELLLYMQEQAVCLEAHRHGNPAPISPTLYQGTGCT